VLGLVNRPHRGTLANVELENGIIIQVPYDAINYAEQKPARYIAHPTVLSTPEPLPDTGGAALLPLLGAVMLIGGGFVSRRLTH
jgi:LPXTG-motif cell wall-anchored protein